MTDRDSRAASRTIKSLESSASRVELPTKSALLRQSILKATLDLLEEEGYANATTDQIALRARVSKASIYRFWASKQQLVVDAASLRFPTISVPDMGDFEKEIRHLLETRMADYRQAGTLRLVAGLLGAASNDPTLEVTFEKWVEQLSSTIRHVIQRGIARGDVRLDIDIHAFESLIAGVLSRSVIVQKTFSEGMIEQIAVLLATAASCDPDPGV